MEQKKIKTELNKNNYKKIRIFPGISSVSYLSAATGIAWQDAKIISIHGKKDTAETRALVLDAIRHFPQDVSAGFRGGGCPTDRMLDRRRKFDANPHYCWISALL